MSPLFLGLVPLTPVDLMILDRLGPALGDFLSLPVRLLPALSLPPHTHHPGRNQYHSNQLLEYLLQTDLGEEPWRILGITGMDLYIPIFTFVFGEAQLDGKAAIISTFRPEGGAGDPKPSGDLLLSRLLKLGLHELGHTFSLAHCRQPGCLMGFAPNLEKLDRVNLELCQYCRILLNDYFSTFLNR